MSGLEILIFFGTFQIFKKFSKLFFLKGLKILPNGNGNVNKFRRLWNVLLKRMLMMFGSSIHDNNPIKEQWNLLIWHLNLGSQKIINRCPSAKYENGF